MKDKAKAARQAEKEKLHKTELYIFGGFILIVVLFFLICGVSLWTA